MAAIKCAYGCADSACVQVCYDAADALAQLYWDDMVTCGAANDCFGI